MACVANIHKPKLLVVEPRQGVVEGSTVAVLRVKTDQDGHHKSGEYSSLGYPLDKPTTHNPAGTPGTAAEDMAAFF